MFHSPRVGGCTFPEDPAQSCALIQPIWSAAVDPYVLKVRARPHLGAGHSSIGQTFDLRRFHARVVSCATSEHVRIDHCGKVLRLDVVAGTLLDGPVSLAFELSLGPGLAAQLEALRDFGALFTTSGSAARASHSRLSVQLLALRAKDARLTGASLRTIAEELLGEGDWPGAGEYRKSKARRLVVMGHALVRAGPRAILA